MKKILTTVFAAAVAVVAFTAVAVAYDDTRLSPQMFQSSFYAPTANKGFVRVADTTTVQTSAPVSATTTVKGGDVAASFIEWLQVAFGAILGTGATALVVKGLQWLGVQVTDQMRAQLQSVIVNGLNDAAAKAETTLRAGDSMNVTVKNQIVADAVKYTQDHASQTIKALGLDPQSGQAVEAIKARIQTALNDPATPTPAAITPASGQPGGVVINNSAGV